MAYSKDHESLRSRVNSHNLMGRNADRFFNLIKKEEKSVGQVLEIVRRKSFIQDLFIQPSFKASSSPLTHIFSYLNLNAEQKRLIHHQSLVVEEEESKEEESQRPEAGREEGLEMNQNPL